MTSHYAKDLAVTSSRRQKNVTYVEYQSTGNLIHGQPIMTSQILSFMLKIAVQKN